MRRVNKRLLWIGTLVLGIGICLLTVYMLALSLSGYRDISSHSVERYILIPSMMRSSMLEGSGAIIGYTYQAADGVKPFIVETRILTTEKEEAVLARINQYFSSMGFEQQANNILIRKNQEIAIYTEETNDSTLLVKIALIDDI